MKPLSTANTGSGDGVNVHAEISDTKSAPTSAAATTKREVIVFRSNSQNDKDNSEKIEPPLKVPRNLGRRTSTNTNDSVPIKVTPSPARHPPSRIIHVRNLVRPFTLNQLKELLSKTGALIEGGFWIDKIKSKCYVTYETEEQAVNTRQALHGTQWPSSNPKILSVDFATQDELDFHRNLAESEAKAPPQIEAKVPEAPNRIKVAAAPRSRKLEDEKPVEKSRRDLQRDSERENKEKEQADEKDKRDDRSRNRQLQEINVIDRERTRDRRDRDDHRDRIKDKGRQPPIREWDREKIGERSPGERERARAAHNRNKSRSRSRSRGARNHPERDRNDRRREEEAPAKLLDDLFRKTKATPCIYWLPLTLEQIQMKDEQRKQRQVEREKRRQQNQVVENVKSNQRSRSRDREESRNYRKSKSPAKPRSRRR